MGNNFSDVSDMTPKLSKHSLSDLHDGHIEAPLKATAQQVVKEGDSSPRAPKGMGRSVSKDIVYNAKKRMK